jgi:AraC-like DNA-binding protein
MMRAERKPMSSRIRTPPKQEGSASDGLFRSILAGPGHTLPDAFASLERASHAKRVLRHPVRDLLGARITLAPEEGEGYWDLTRIRGELYVVVANFVYKDPRIELVPGDGLVQFNFKISGDMALAVSRAESLRWNRPSLLVWSQPEGVDISERTAPRAREQFVIISMRPEFLAQNLLPPGAHIPDQLEAFASSRVGGIIYCHHPLSAQALEAATRLINNPHTGPLALIYTEALALELLCSAMAGLSRVTGAPAEEYDGRELRCLHAARDVLMRQFAPAPAIGNLARSVGMSRSTLTKGFKAVFGETIFDFSLRCRMRHALELMRDQGLSVEQAGRAVGYAHPTSFTTAFRRHFGFRPIDVRRVKTRNGHRLRSSRPNS